ncbi:hypothetical protein [Nocardia sp. MDA0666]|uniref:hypothetical protein n=1 Tax=Nocardia sp. MDA0666 TaxID=2135448 RepID=UPI0011B223DE|nr:hypothetical protein [Nocardia sp. MDA0666]
MLDGLRSIAPDMSGHLPMAAGRGLRQAADTTRAAFTDVVLPQSQRVEETAWRAHRRPDRRSPSQGANSGGCPDEGTTTLATTALATEMVRAKNSVDVRTAAATTVFELFRSEGDVHLRIWLQDVAFDYVATAPAALAFIDDWSRHPTHTIEVVLATRDRGPLPRLPNERLFYLRCDAASFDASN